MKKLDKILYEHLKDIRDELNSYIQEKIVGGYVFFNGNRCVGTSAPQVQISEPQFLHSEMSRRNIDEVLANKAETFSNMLLRLIDEKGLKDSDVYKKANIDRRLFSKIRGDEDYVPSKKTAISFCLALQLEMDEARKLLKTAGYTLSESSRFDLIISYLIENREYNIHFANIENRLYRILNRKIFYFYLWNLLHF